MAQIQTKSAKMEDTIDVSKVIGKKVISKDGRKIGKLESVHIHPKKLTVEGIWVDKGIMDIPDYIGKGYIDSIQKSGVFLKILPFIDLVGMKVYDSSGKKIGKVTHARRSGQTNYLTSIVVDRGVLKKEVVIPKKDIKNVGANIRLNKKIVGGA